MSEYTEAVMNDGAAILKDGVPVTITEILELLNGIDSIEKQTAEKCAQIALDLNEHCGCGYHISRKIQEDFGVDV